MDVNKLLPQIDGLLRQVLSLVLAIVAGIALLRILGVAAAPRLAESGQNLGILLAALAYVLRR